MPHDIPEYIGSDSGQEFISKDLRSWLSGIWIKTICIKLKRPWKNSFCDSLNDIFRDNLLDGENFYSLKKRRITGGQTL